jgi:hypothetical protein
VIPASCRTPTQIEIIITTDIACSDLQGVSITAGPPDAVEGAPPSTATTSCRPAGDGYEIGTIVVAPEGAKDSAVGIRVVAGVNSSADACTAENAYAGCVVARRRLNYVPHTELVLRIPMRGACLDVACDAQSTCVAGECKDSLVRTPSECTGEGCGEESLGGGGAGAGGAGAGGAGGGPPVAVFELLDVPPGTDDVEVLGVSDDGRTVTGSSFRQGMWLPIVWQPESAPPYRDLSIGGVHGWVKEASDDGRVLVGRTSVSPRGTPANAATWTEVDGVYQFAEPSFAADYSHTTIEDCDDACAVFAGVADAQAYVLYQGQPLVLSGSPSSARGMKGDASIVVGESELGFATLWTVSSGFPVQVWTDPGGAGTFVAITDDGSVAVGHRGAEGFYLTYPDVDLGLLPGGAPQAVAGSATDFRAVGNCDARACTWVGGVPVDLQTAFLADYQGAVTLTAADITADARIIVGVASTASGNRPYRLTIP